MPRILLVDDEPMLLAMMELALRLEGFPVVTAGSGVEAISVFLSRPGDIGLLITEVDLPRMDGPVLAAKLLAQDPELPVLFVSDRVQDMPLGGSRQFEFLPKPFPLKTLIAEVRRLLRSQAAPAVN